MKLVVFVGDEPSKLNISPDIPFVGAKCFNTFIGWVNKLKPDYYVTLNSDNISDLSDIIKLYKSGFKVVALGNKASERLKKKGIEHKKLPHPSPLNRILNNKKVLDKQLKEVYSYIKD
jgi:hypothetical protein